LIVAGARKAGATKVEVRVGEAAAIVYLRATDDAVTPSNEWAVDDANKA
jgi:hypothetical protein